MYRERKRKSRASSKSQSNVPAFLLKTYEILENPTYQDIVSWNKEGNAFIVKKVTDFSEKVLPKYFKHNNFASFVRQLNMYDFHKARNDESENEFRHKLFKRGHKNLLGDIKRKTSEGGFTTQLVPYDKVFDIDKVKRECNTFTRDLSLIKSRQTELEKVTQMMCNQNTQLVRENKLLWNEMLKSKDKYERKIEKLMLFIFSIMHFNGGQALTGLMKKGLGNGDIDEELKDLSGELELNAKDITSNDMALQLIPETTKNNDKMIKKIMKFFKSKDEKGLDGLLDMMGKDQNRVEIPSGLLEDDPEETDSVVERETPSLEHFELPKRKKGRPKKIKPLTSEEQMIETEPRKLLKTSLNSSQFNLLSDQEEMSDKNIEEEIEQSPMNFKLKKSQSIQESPLGTPKLMANNFSEYENGPFTPLKEEYTGIPVKSEIGYDDKLLDSPYFGPEVFMANASPHQNPIPEFLF